MYSPFQLAKKYFHYYFTASNAKGHGVHSPFVFDFIKNVLNDKKNYECYGPIEKLRNKLLKNKSSVSIIDFGAGSRSHWDMVRRISDIAKTSLKPKKYSQLLFRIVQYYKPKTIIELGTSFGITTSYLAFANPSAKIITMEGAPSVADMAEENFKQLELKNIEIRKGNINKMLTPTIEQLSIIDFSFIDGNHRKDPTIYYFEELINKANDQSIFIFDDIHWSAEMEGAWKEIQQHPSVTLTIDLFFIGLVFFKKDFKAKQHFVIRF